MSGQGDAPIGSSLLLKMNKSPTACTCFNRVLKIRMSKNTLLRAVCSVTASPVHAVEVAGVSPSISYSSGLTPKDLSSEFTVADNFQMSEKNPQRYEASVWEVQSGRLSLCWSSLIWLSHPLSPSSPASIMISQLRVFTLSDYATIF